MVTTPQGNLSSKRAPGKTWKRHLRIERICRLSLQIPPPTDDEIAISQGVTKQYVSMLRRTPEYIAIRMQLMTGVVAQHDRELLENIEDNSDFIKSLVPEALQALHDTILDRTNPALRLRAAESLLDREGTLAKISKTEIKKKVEFDFTAVAEVENDLLAALRANCAEGTLGSQPQNGYDNGVSSFSHTELSQEAKETLQNALKDIESVIITPQQTSQVQ